MRKIKEEYCGNCLQSIAESKPVAYWIGNEMACWLDCFYAMVEVSYDND